MARRTRRRAADRLHQALDGRGAARVRQVQVRDDEVNVAFREQRERVGSGACAVELHIGERDASQVRADDLDADRVVFEQQNAHRLGKRRRALDEFRTRLQYSSPGGNPTGADPRVYQAIPDAPPAKSLSKLPG